MDEAKKVLDLAQKNEFIEKLASALDMQAEDLVKGLIGNNVELPEIVPKTVHESAIKNLGLDHEVKLAAHGKSQYEEGKKVESEKGLRKRKQHYKDKGIETDGVKDDLELIDLVVSSKVGEKSKTEQEFQSMIKDINEKHDSAIKEMESRLKNSKIDQKIWEGINLIQFNAPADVKDENEISSFIKNKRKDAFILAKAGNKFDIYADEDQIEHLGVLKADGSFKKHDKTFANINWSDEVIGWAKSKHFNLTTPSVKGRPDVNKPVLENSYAGISREKLDAYIAELQEKGEIPKGISKASDEIVRKWFAQNPQS